MDGEQEEGEERGEAPNKALISNCQGQEANHAEL
jgi:hypothetical protein